MTLITYNACEQFRIRERGGNALCQQEKRMRDNTDAVHDQAWEMQTRVEEIKAGIERAAGKYLIKSHNGADLQFVPALKLLVSWPCTTLAYASLKTQTLMTSDRVPSLLPFKSVRRVESFFGSVP